MEKFEGVYRAYFQDVYLYLCSLTGDASLAEELTSETFFRAMRAIGRFRGECEMRVWLCQIAKNCFFDHCRRQKKSLPPGESDAPALLPENEVLQKDDIARIHRHLHDLPEPYKEVFMLRVFGELGFKEIGALFGKSANWACVAYHRAREKIRKRMEEEE